MPSVFPVTHSVLSAEALGRKVAAEYSLGDLATCRLLQRWVVDTYLATSTNGARYVIRAYRTGWRSRDEILFEIDLLSHLARRGAAVSTAIPRRDGAWITKIRAPEGPRFVVVFTYAQGRPVTSEGRDYYHYGRTAALIHRLAADFKSRRSRFDIDLEHLVDRALGRLAPYLSHRVFDLRYLEQLGARLNDRIAREAARGLPRGICHGDLHLGNAHITEDNTVTFFDFDFAGRGWLAYDLGVFWWASTFAKDERAWSLFLQGYTKERPLDARETQTIPLFGLLREIWYLGLLCQNAPDWGPPWFHDRFFDDELKTLKAWEAEHFPA